MEMLLILIIVIVLMFVLPLLGFHCGLVMMGRNTHEHVTGKFNSKNPNPFDLGTITNCLTFSCGPEHPKYIRYKSSSPDPIPFTERYKPVQSSESLSVESSRIFEPNSSLQLNPLDTSTSGNSLGDSSLFASADHGANNTYINIQTNADTNRNYCINGTIGVSSNQQST